MVVNGSDGLAVITTDWQLVRYDLNVKDEKIEPKRDLNTQPEKALVRIFSEPPPIASLLERSLYPRL
jgi:hypothetical protein